MSTPNDENHANRLAVMHSSDRMDWATPKALYDELDREFGFTIDVCASDWNAKHPRYWSEADDALKQDWSKEVCFMNPPYGRGIRNWVEKARLEASRGALVVGLIPARTDTSYWFDHIHGIAEVRFVKGRVKFERPDGPGDAAPFASAIVIWRPNV